MSERERLSADPVGGCGLGGQVDHLVPASCVGPLALGVGAAKDAGLLLAEGAGAGGRFQEFKEGHGMSLQHRSLQLRSCE